MIDRWKVTCTVEGTEITHWFITGMEADSVERSLKTLLGVCGYKQETRVEKITMCLKDWYEIMAEQKLDFEGKPIGTK